MGILDSDWQRLHKKINRQYELIALKNFESGVSREGADVLGVIARIVRENIPTMNRDEAENFVKNE